MPSYGWGMEGEKMTKGAAPATWEGGVNVSYRRVGYLEQCWYIVSYWLSSKVKNRNTTQNQ